MRKFYTFVFVLVACYANAQTYHLLSGGSFTQNWADKGLITTNDVWTGVPSIIGYRGDNLTASTGTDPQTI
ncbi:MAG: hypothetical protein KGZ74_15610, partial [Chitinophagaceae bacterium]|nr:hypothetical protein [Chitinophagaceae bacterium]